MDRGIATEYADAAEVAVGLGNQGWSLCVIIQTAGLRPGMSTALLTAMTWKSAGIRR